MKAGRRFRVERTDAQARLAQQTADACRAVWNTGLEQRREYRRRGAWMNYEQQAHELVEAKREHTWRTEAPSHCLQQTLRDLDEACRTPPAPRLLCQDRTPVGAQKRLGRAGEAAGTHYDSPC